MTTETPAIPVTIIGGYLGAGKTTLLNTLLRGDHGLRLAILVNDFGSINIDAALIAIHDGETISLTNGCVCCSMVDNLAITLLELLGREPPPDQIVIEASGVADPHRIVFYGAADPRLRLDGLILVADAETLPLRLRDKIHRRVGHATAGRRGPDHNEQGRPDRRSSTGGSARVSPRDSATSESRRGHSRGSPRRLAARYRRNASGGIVAIRGAARA